VYGKIEQTLVLVGLGAARTIPIAWSIPAFGGPTLPGQIRVALGLGLAALCFPFLTAANSLDGDVVFWIAIVAREVVVGLVMGFVCSCVFRAAEAAGQITDIVRGANLAVVLSPIGEGRSSPFGGLMLLLSIVVFLEIGGIGHVAAALGRSYEAIPLTSHGVLGTRPRAMAILVIIASAKLIESIVGLCAPVIVALLLADIFLGVLGRAIPQVPVYFVGMPLKALLGVGVMLLALAGFDVSVQTCFHGFLGLLGSNAWLGR
jgi:type III secretory pathway component EscT